MKGRNKEISTQIDVSDIKSRQKILATCLSKPDLPEAKLRYQKPVYKVTKENDVITNPVTLSASSSCSSLKATFPEKDKCVNISIPSINKNTGKDTLKKKARPKSCP